MMLQQTTFGRQSFGGSEDMTQTLFQGNPDPNYE